jgi:hypothetical protein
MQKPPVQAPSGPKKKPVAGIFNAGRVNHKTPPAVARAKTEAYSRVGRKNGYPHTDQDDTPGGGERD